MNKVYNCDIWVLTNAIAVKGKQLLSIDRKLVSLRNEEFDMSKTFIISFSREDFDKLNYTYTFFLYEYVSDFDMDRFKKFFYLNNTKKEELELICEKSTRSEINEKLKTLQISDEMFKTDDLFLDFKTNLKELIDNVSDMYKVGELILLYIVSSRISQIQFYTGNMEESVKILKKKSAEKIDKTLWNRYLHLTLYGKDDASLDI